MSFYFSRYPLGHPDIITSNFDLTLASYFGIAYCKVVPPPQLYHPVLPYAACGKLKFPLCRTCAEKETSHCRCTEEERAITGTWCTPELLKAIEKGYQVTKIYEVYTLFSL